MTEKELAEALASIDLDGNGIIQFHEFACWWVSKPKRGSNESDSQEHKMLALKLKMLKRAKGVMGRMSLAGFRNGGKKARENQKKAMLQPLRLTREEDADRGVVAGISKLFGGSSSSNRSNNDDKSGGFFRPKTV